MILIIIEILLSSASTITSSNLSTVNPSIGIMFSSNTDLSTSIAILITVQYISK